MNIFKIILPIVIFVATVFAVNEINWIRLGSGFDGAGVYTLVNIDGCEYIIWEDTGKIGTIIHKANCKNPIHKQPVPKTELRVYVSSSGYFKELREEK